MRLQTGVRLGRRALVATALGLGMCAAAAPASAQAFKDLQTPKTPLTLKATGSFMVGGQSVEQTPTQLSSIFGPPPAAGGKITIHQMYVQYMIPASGNGVPVVMLHGATLSGKTYETTPDGRMGWYEYFVRRGHPVYVPDQVSRARSGFDISIYNDVRAIKALPTALPNAFRQTDEINWKVFRFGPGIGTPFADQQFPVAAADQMSAQAVPDLNAVLPTPNPTFKALADLAEQLQGAVVMGHSESGAFPLFAALTNPEGMRGLILVEPGACAWTPFSDEQMSRLTRVPILAVFGDHLEADTGMPGFSWKNAYDNCVAFIAKLNSAGGKAAMLYPPERGIRGNSHMIMQDRNNLQIADLILSWIDRNVGKGARR